jgi:predicted HicB family RNase H-like nuclease
VTKYKGYIGKVEYDPQAKLLHGEVAGLRDVITFQSDSTSRIEKAFRDSVDDYLAFCRERGERPEHPHSVFRL